MKKVKITILKTTLDKELAAEYGIDELTACPMMKASDVFYAVRSDCRGMHIGEKLVLDCLAQAKEHGFGVLQFNAVVEGNIHARHLYERLGFTQLGTIPRGFRMKDGSFANICPYYKDLA